MAFIIRATLIYIVIKPIAINMLETVKYLLGSAGASGYGSKSTAEQVTDGCPNLSSVTAIITGKLIHIYN